MKKYIAEGIGTYILCFTVLLSLSGAFFLPAPLAAALVLFLSVNVIGKISGSHINPAVSLGMWYLKKLTGKDLAFYVLAQISGAFLARFSLFFIKGHFFSPAVTGMPFTPAIFFAEFLGTAIFTLGVGSTIYIKIKEAAPGVIAGSLFLGIMVASLIGSNGVINPAVALSLDLFNLSYILGPLAGGIFGLFVARTLEEGKPAKRKHSQ